MKLLSAQVFTDRGELSVVRLAPRAVVDDFAASDADHADCARWVAQRVGEGQIGAVAMPKHQPAVKGIRLSHGLGIEQQRVEIVVAIPVGSATASRLEANNLAPIVDQARNRLQIIVAA